MNGARETVDSGRGTFTQRANESCVLCSLGCVRLPAAPWTVAHEAPLSLGFSKQEYWRGLPFPLPGDLPNAGIEPASLLSCIGKWVLYH